MNIKPKCDDEKKKKKKNELQNSRLNELIIQKSQAIMIIICIEHMHSFLIDRNANHYFYCTEAILTP